MSGAAESPGSKRGAGPAATDWGPAQGDVVALIRMVCSQGVRRGVRVVATDKRGHIFFDQGHVVHAEFGEDVGLGAVIEMLQSRPVEFRPCARPWPSQPTLFFTAEKLLAATRPSAAITGVRLKAGLLSGEAANERSERTDSTAVVTPAPASAPPRGSSPPPPAAPPLAGAVTELSRAVAAAVHRTSSSGSPTPLDGPEATPAAGSVAPGATPGTAGASVAPARAGLPAPRPAARTLRGPFTAPPPAIGERVAPPTARSARSVEPEAAPPSEPKSGAFERAPLAPARTVALPRRAEPVPDSRPGRELPRRDSSSQRQSATAGPNTSPRDSTAPRDLGELAPPREPLTPARTLPVAPSPAAQGAPAVGVAPMQSDVTPASARRSISVSSRSAPGSSPKSAPSAAGSAPGAAPASAPAPDSSPSSAPISAALAAAVNVSEPSAARGGADVDGEREPQTLPRPRLPVVWVQHAPSPGGRVPSFARPHGSPVVGSPVASSPVASSPVAGGAAAGGSVATSRAGSSPVAAPEPASEQPSTTMVRVSSRGVLLAARGAQSEQLANAAAFIHNQARLIAQDLGRHGRTAVHLRGGELSLLVVKSEVNDIAAALGPSERLRSLLRKAGLG